MAYGLTDEGFAIKDQEILLDELDARLRSNLGNQIDLTGGVLARLRAIFNDPVVLLWELGEALHSATDPDAATQAALDAVCALTGAERDPEASSTVPLTLTGTPTTVVPTGSRASVTGSEDGAEFATLANATITALTAWAASTAYAVGDRRTNSSRAYVCITAGVSAGSGGPTTTAADITDGTVHWRYMGQGTGAIDANAESVEKGAIEGVSGTITTIETAVSGWSSVINLLDSTLGRTEESDEDLRIKREDELAAAGTSPVDAIRNDLLDVEGVTSVTVFHNPTDETDADGVPPHSVEALVQGGDDQDIFDQLLRSVAGGIRTYGTESGTSLDDEGNTQAMAFSRPEERTIYVAITLTKDADEYPSDGDAQVKAAIVAYGDMQRTGRDVVPAALSAQPFIQVSGVLNVTDLRVGTSPGPTGTAPITITTRQLAIYDTSRVTVTSSDGTP